MSQVITNTRGMQRNREDSLVNRRTDAIVDEHAQRVKFGGFHFGAAFFGWLVSTGIGAILTSILVAAGSAVAVTNFKSTASNLNINPQAVATVGLVSGILLLAVLCLSYFTGGYVAGRMTRFDGARQGFGVWIMGIIIALVLGGVSVALGSQYNVLQQLNLLHIPIKSGNFTTLGLIITILSIVLTLLVAMAGGKLGEAYHRKVDAEGTVGELTR